MEPGRGDVGQFKIGDVISQNFQILGRQFWPLIGIQSIYWLPAVPVMAASFAIYVQMIQTMASHPNDQAAMAQALQGMQLSPLVTIFAFLSPFLGLFAFLATTYLAAHEIRHDSPGIRAALAAAVKRFFPSVGAYLLVMVIIVGLGLATMVVLMIVVGVFSMMGKVGAVIGMIVAAIGYIFFLVGNFVVFLTFSLAVPACVIDNYSVTASLSRSRFLTKGNLWRLLGLFLLVEIAVSIVLLIATSILTALFGMTTGFVVAGLALIPGFIFVSLLPGVVYQKLCEAKDGPGVRVANVFA